MNYKKYVIKRSLPCHCSPLGQTGCRWTEGVKGPIFKLHQKNRKTRGAENPAPLPTTFSLMYSSNNSSQRLANKAQVANYHWHNHFIPFSFLLLQNQNQVSLQPDKQDLDKDMASQRTRCIPKVMLLVLEPIILYQV